MHWEKIDHNEATSSFWKNQSTSTLASDLMSKGVFDEIEIIFAAKEIKKLATKKKEDIDKISFLSRDVAQQFSINLHAFNQLSDEEFVAKVLRCDKDIITNHSVLEFFSKDEITEITNSAARNFEPYSTDYKVEDITKPEKDPSELKRPDRIFLELMYNLQHYWKSRNRALTIVAHYEKDYEDLVSKLRAIDESVDSIKNSNSLRGVFEIILTVGNYMNDTSKQAKGFKLNSLQRLSFMKDEKNSMTFLHYVEKLIRTQYPELQQFLDDLAKCNDIAKFSIESIYNDCKDYARAVKNIQTSIDIGNLSDISKFHPLDRVLKVVLPTLPRASHKAQLLIDQANFTIKQFDDLMIYFGEDPSDQFVKNSFVSKFTNFMREYKRVQAENVKREEEIRIYEQRRKLLETPKKLSAELGERRNDNASENDEDNENGDEGVMDSLLEKLKAAGPARGEPTSARKKAMLRRQILENQRKFANSSTSPSKDGRDSEISEDDLTLLQESESTDSVDSKQTEVRSSRAKNLLQELRGANEDDSEESVSLAQKYRQERLKKKLTIDSSSSSSSSSAAATTTATTNMASANIDATTPTTTDDHNNGDKSDNDANTDATKILD